MCPVVDRSLNKANQCRYSEEAVKKIKLLEEGPVKFWLLTLTQNWVLRLVTLKKNLRKKRNNKNNNKKSSRSSSNNKNSSSSNNSSSKSSSNNKNSSSSNNKPQQKTDHRLQQVADYQPGDRLMEGTHIFNRLVGPVKGVKKSEDPYINKDSSPLSVLILFNAEILHLLVEQTNIYYQQHLHGQARPSH